MFIAEPNSLFDVATHQNCKKV